MNDIYVVNYVAGSYAGCEIVAAEDGEHAIAKVRAKVRKLMTLPMYSDSYKIVEINPEEHATRSCDVCSRSYKHTHCTECGDTSHLADDCDMGG